MSDSLFDGRPLRCFTLVDDFTRECVAIGVAHAQPAWRVIHVLEAAARERGLPRTIVCDNGPEFTSKALDRWACEHGVTLQFIRPGKPVENAFCESFNGKLRGECLSANWFASLADVTSSISTGSDWPVWRTPHSRAGSCRGLPRHEEPAECPVSFIPLARPRNKPLARRWLVRERL